MFSTSETSLPFWRMKRTGASGSGLSSPFQCLIENGYELPSSPAMVPVFRSAVPIRYMPCEFFHVDSWCLIYSVD